MRGKFIPKRNIKADPKYKSLVVAKWINYIMQDGKKSVAQNIIYNALDEIDSRLKAGKVENAKKVKDVMEFLDIVLEKIIPVVEVKGRRVGGSNYQIPVPVKGNRRYFLAFKWLNNAAKARKGKPMHMRIVEELLDAYQGLGAAVKKREDVYRMASANRAFAHLAKY